MPLLQPPGSPDSLGHVMDGHDEIGGGLDEGHSVEGPSLCEVVALARVGNAGRTYVRKY